MVGEGVAAPLDVDGLLLGTVASPLAMGDGDMELLVELVVELGLGDTVSLDTKEGIIVGTIVSLPLAVVLGVLLTIVKEGIMVLSKLELDVGAALGGVSPTEGVGDDVVGSAVPSEEATVGEDDGIALSSVGQSTVSSGIPWKKRPSV